MNWFLRMALWVRRPPSAKRVMLVLGVVGLCGSLYAVERWIGWPKALSIDRVGRSPMMR